jgi:hypothetical protein
MTIVELRLLQSLPLTGSDERANGFRPVFLIEGGKNVMQNPHRKRPFNRKNLSAQIQSINTRELNRQQARDRYRVEKRVIFCLKAAYIGYCAAMLYVTFFQAQTADHVANWLLFGVLTAAIFTTFVFISGSVAPKSFWGRIDKLRQRRAWNDKRFEKNRIMVLELKVGYILICCHALRVCVFSNADLFSKGVYIFLFTMVTFAIFLALVYFSKPRSFWGRMQRSIWGYGKKLGSSK